ncbi:MAG: site-2 protease family protein [Clostridia bacterium]|jgi:Zn-dependent protease|nr:site-2 protease family protein [Clostridia bacterium]
MQSNFRLGRVFGIPIEINFSWLIIFFLIFWSLSQIYFPPLLPEADGLIYGGMALIGTLLFFISLLLHELAHSLTSIKHGIHVKRIVLFLFGGVAEITQEASEPSMEFKIAIAGPLTSFALGGMFWGLSKLGGFLAVSQVVLLPLNWLAFVNVFLGFFNLLPGFPLDGGRVLRSVVWGITGNFKKATKLASNMGQAVALLLIFSGGLFLLSGFFINGIWFLLLGWILQSSATMGYKQVLIAEALKDITVGELMTSPAATISGEEDLGAAVDQYFAKHPFTAYPVVDEQGTPQGIISANQVKSKSQHLWKQTQVKNIMSPLEANDCLQPDSPGVSALEKLHRNDIGRLPVIEQGKIVGILSRSDILRWLNWQAGL